MPRWIIALLCCFALVSCGGGGGTTPSDTPPVILSITLPNSVMLGTALQLRANVLGSVDTWQWSFSEIGPDPVAEAQPTVHFDRLGRFTGTLIATNAAGSSAPFEFSTKVITEGVVAEPPVVQSVGPSDVVGFEGQPIGFLATATNLPEKWAWSFEGGANPRISDDPNPQVILAAEGTHTGSVVISNAYGSSAPFPFTFTVTAPDIDRGARIVSLEFGGEMGEPGTQLVATAETFDFPSFWEWEFGAGSQPKQTNDPHPTLTLGPAGLYTGSLTIQNRLGGQKVPFTFSTGGFENARMAQQYGGCWQGAQDLVPLSDGGIAALVSTSTTENYDLDPRMTTMRLEHPFFGSTKANGGRVIVMVDAEGAPKRVFQWSTLSVMKIARGPQDNLLVYLRYFAASGAGNPPEVSIAPRPTEQMIPAGDTPLTVIVALDSDGQVQWHQIEPTRAFVPSVGQLVTGPDGSVFFTSRSTEFTDSFTKLHKLTPQGDPLWQMRIPFEPTVLRGTPSGGVYYTGDLLGFSSDVDGSVDGVDMRFRLGTTDALVTRLSATGAYMHTWQLGGDGFTRAPAPADLLVRPDSSVVIGGLWDQGDLDFDPGPGIVHSFTELCSPSFSFPPRAYALHLAVDGAFLAVSSWDAQDAQFGTMQLADFGDDGYAIAWRLSPCSSAGPVKDLDPGPGTAFPLPTSDMAIARIDGNGNLRAHAEWDVPFGFVTSLAPVAGGGLHVLVTSPATDMDPGPAVFDPSPFSNQFTPWHVFLTPELTWGAPTT